MTDYDDARRRFAQIWSLKLFARIVGGGTASRWAVGIPEHDSQLVGRSSTAGADTPAAMPRDRYLAGPRASHSGSYARDGEPTVAAEQPAGGADLAYGSLRSRGGSGLFLAITTPETLVRRLG